MDLVELLKRPEGKTLEFKRDLSSPDGVLRTLVAFANTAGGSLLLGVEDGTRRVRGVRDPHQVEERLASLVSDTVVPRLLPDIDVVAWRRTHVVAVTVYPSALRPHHIKSLGAENSSFVRVGSTNRRADTELRAELGRYARGETYDAQPMPELDVESIDLALASEAFSGYRDLARRDLETLRLTTRFQGRLVPTVAGIVLFGRDRLTHFPDAWIQVGRFAGKDRSRISDRAEIRGSPVGAVGETLHHINRHLLLGAEIGAMRRRDRWSLPPVAIREALMNAIVHCDYSQRGAPIRIAIYDDRLEIENPGLLPLGLTTEELPYGISKLRNPVIGRVFHEIELIEQWGSGIQRMIGACREAGHPPPVFEEIGTRFRVTIAQGSRAARPVDVADAAIIEALSAGDGLSTTELSRLLGRSARSTRTRLARLVDRGLVREVGMGPTDPKRKYYLAKSR
ncbi:MAG: ATP-binding protein [Gemmatimonadota bacterium]